MGNEHDTTASVFHCDQCGFELHVRAELGGRRTRCPKCGTIGRVPGPEASSNEHPSPPLVGAGDGHVSAGGSYIPGERTKAQAELCPYCHQLLPSGMQHSPAATAPSATETLPAKTEAGRPAHPSAGIPGLPPADPMARCPYCRELIMLGARKCKHCGEFLDETLRLLSPRRTGRSEHSTGKAGGAAAQPPRLRQIMIAGIFAAALAISTGGYFAFRGAHTAPASAPADKGANQTATAPVSDPKLQEIATKLEKLLTGTSTRDATDNLLTFSTAEKAVVPWSCEIQKTNNPRNPVKGVISVPYQSEIKDGRTASSKGRYVLEFYPHGSQWDLDQVLKETRVLVRNGKESEVPDEDRTYVKQSDEDLVVGYLRRSLAKQQSPSPE